MKNSQHRKNPLSLSQLSIATGSVTINIEGTGPTALLFIHGFPGRPQDFRWLTPYLIKECTLYQLTLPGLGITPKEVCEQTGITAYGDFVLQCIDALQFSNFAIVGHSMGGPIATYVASRRPEQCRQLILLSSVGINKHQGFRKSPPQLTHWLLQRSWLHPLLLPLLRLGFRSLGFPKGLHTDTMLHIIDHAAHFSFTEHHQNLVSWMSLEDASRRTAMIWTTNDRLIEEKIYREMSTLLQPSLELQYSSGGHNPQKEHAEEISNQLLSWLQSSHRS